MLNIVEQGRSLNRRELLTIGGLGLGGAVLSSWLGHVSCGAELAKLATGRSVIFLFQQGGPSQFETFDPKPAAPDGIRTVTGTCQTSLPGVLFGDSLPRLAALADKLTIVRSFQSNNAGHNIQPIVGPDTRQANIGSLYSRVVGAANAENGLSTNCVIFPDSVCDDVLKGRARGDIAATGKLGAAYAPFIPGAGGQLQKDMRLNLPQDRFADRQELMEQLGALSERMESSEPFQSLERAQQQAYRVLLGGGVADALDLTREAPETIARYDTAQFTRPDGWSQAKRGKQGMYTGHAKALGKQLLLARRLCEAGCGFVTIHAGYDGVWDMHADGNNLNMVDGMQAVGLAFDHAVAALVEDIEARGLQDKILLVATGEMGRTPRINRNGGRDHWARLAPLLLYGGGLPEGRIIGQSTRDGGEPASQPLTPKHLVSTLLHKLFDAGQLRLQSGLSQVASLAEHPTFPV
ncbi:MAG: DUF1501 domain-containing protein [Pirellulales bacterium]